MSVWATEATKASSRVLMLHRVLSDAPAVFGLPDCYRIRGTALALDELLHVLDHAGPFLPLEAVERALAAGEQPPIGAVLTFDDGYREHLDVVAPLLSKRGVTATFYVATGIHGGAGAVAVVDAWYWLLDHSRRDVATVPMPDGSSFRGRLDTVDSKAAWVSGVPKAALLAATPEHQRRMLDALAEGTGSALPSDLAARLYLRPEEWRSLAGLGMRVGAHGVRHQRLTQVADGTLADEIHESVATVMAVCSPVAFSYPDGAFDERVTEQLRFTRVSSAVTCQRGVLLRGMDRLRLPRFHVATPGAIGSQ